MKNKNLTVVKDNKIIEASYSLSLAEQRILLACIAQIDSRSVLDSENEFQISAADIVDLMAIDKSQAYRDMRAAINRLYNRSIKIDGKNDEMRWIYRRKYQEGGGRISLYFSPEIIPYLSQLSQKFTQYKLEYVANFKSSYSIRLYELLVQWSSAGEREVEVEWLKSTFQISNKYASIRDLKDRVIEPAIADINEHSNLWVQYGQRKTGRTVTHLQFVFGIKGQTEGEPVRRKKPTAEEIVKAARPGETLAEVKARLAGKPMAKIARPGESAAQARRRLAAKGDFR